MDFKKWFDSQDKLIRIILLVIPFVGWIVEILLRVSCLLKKQTPINIIGLVLFAVTGLIVTYCDLVWILLNGHNILME